MPRTVGMYCTGQGDPLRQDSSVGCIVCRFGGPSRLAVLFAGLVKLVFSFTARVKEKTARSCEGKKRVFMGAARPARQHGGWDVLPECVDIIFKYTKNCACCS